MLSICLFIVMPQVKYTLKFCTWVEHFFYLINCYELERKMKNNFSEIRWIEYYRGWNIRIIRCALAGELLAGHQYTFNDCHLHREIIIVTSLMVQFDIQLLRAESGLKHDFNHLTTMSKKWKQDASTSFDFFSFSYWEWNWRYLLSSR